MSDEQRVTSDVSTGRLRRTALYPEHLRLGARMVDFAGWEMPVQYQSILAEHASVRTAAGLFDISHMGRVYVDGVGALDFLQEMTTNDVAALAEFQAEYSLLCRADGTTVDDILVDKLPERYLVVVNAGNRERDLALLRGHLPPGVQLTDATEQTVMLAMQGPKAIGIVERLSAEPLDGLRRYHCTHGVVAGVRVFLARTGYTGEDGLELIVDATAASRVWQALLEAGKGDDLRPCGLGARDTVRTEAGLPLYGHELTDETNPLEAGLGGFVDLDKPDGLAMAALRRVAAAGPTRVLIGLQLDSRLPARTGAPVWQDGTQLGSVTSGTFAPTLQRSIAMAYVEAPPPAMGDRVAVEVRGQHHPATIVPLPFYRRPRRKRSRA